MIYLLPRLCRKFTSKEEVREEVEMEEIPDSVTGIISSEFTAGQ